jgi:hypothetical protein
MAIRKDRTWTGLYAPKEGPQRARDSPIQGGLKAIFIKLEELAARVNVS